MTHTLNIFPIQHCMFSPVFSRQLINRLTNNLNMLNQAKIHNRVSLSLIKSMLIPIIYEHIDSLHHVFKPLYVSNLLSHISTSYHG